jgi:branched-chain amino acid transport system substrate-binding protein
MITQLRTWLVGLLAASLLLAACPAEGPDVTAEPEPDVAEPEDVEPEDVEEPDVTLDEPVRVAFLGSLSGPFAGWGVPTRNGMQLAVDEINAAGGVLGQQIEFLERDDENSPDEGVTALRGLIERDGIVAAGGLISSDVALATSRVAEDAQVPLFLMKAGSHRILTQESRYTFRTCLPAAPMNIEAYAAFIEEQGLTRVGAMIADYEWGHSIREAIEAVVEPLSGVEVQYEIAPVPETDFTTYLRSMGENDPEIILSIGHPPGTPAVTRQSADLGIAEFVTGPMNPQAVVVDAAGEDAFDRYVDLACVDWEDPAYIELAGRYYDEFGAFMEMDAVAGYAAVYIVAEAVTETGSVDPQVVADYIRVNEFDIPGHGYTLAWTEWGGFAGATPVVHVIREMEPPEGVNPGANWYLDVLHRSDPLEPYVP